MTPGDRVTVTTERDPIRGTWKCSAIVKGHLAQMTYYGYTKREAIALFRASVTPVTDMRKQDA